MQSEQSQKKIIISTEARSRDAHCVDFTQMQLLQLPHSKSEQRRNMPNY